MPTTTGSLARILKTLADGSLLEPREAAPLTDAYLGVRSELHVSVLHLPDAPGASDMLQRYRESDRRAHSDSSVIEAAT